MAQIFGDPWLLVQVDARSYFILSTEMIADKKQNFGEI
jgi:hypothetical protein